MKNNNSASIYIHTLYDDAFSDCEISERNYKLYGKFNRTEYTITPKNMNLENAEYSKITFVSDGLYVDSDTVAKVTTTESIDPSLNTVKAVTSDLEANGFKLKGVPITSGAYGYGYAKSTYINDETGEEVVIETTTKDKAGVQSIKKTTTKNTTVGELYTEKTGKVIGQNEDLLPEDEWASEEVSEDNQAEDERIDGTIQAPDDSKALSEEPIPINTVIEKANAEGYNIEPGFLAGYSYYRYLNGIVYCYNGDTLANEIKLSKLNSVSLRIQNENIEGLTNTEFNTEAYENLKGFSFEGAKSKNREVDINDIKKVRDKNCEMIDYFQEDITITSNKITDAYTSINPLTKEELKNKGYSVDDLNEYFFEAYKKLVNNKLNSIVSNLNNIISENIEIDNNESGVRKREYTSYTPSGGGSSSDTPSSNPNETINNIEKVPNYDEVMTKYSSVMVATILFNEITPLFEKLGETTSIQSVQDSEIYKLMGIVKSEDGKYYYQVIDSSTGRIYLADINSNVTLKWDELGERKAVEVVGDSAFVLKSTNEGDNMLERVASKGDVYLVNGDKINVDGIDYYSINDNETGNTAFMPVSDSITNPKLIGEIVKPVVGEVAK